MLHSYSFQIPHHSKIQNREREREREQASYMIQQLRMNTQRASYQMLFYLIKLLPPHLQPYAFCTQHSRAMLYKKSSHLWMVFHPSVFPFLAKPECRLSDREAKMQCCLATARDFPQQPLLILPLETFTSQANHEMQQLISSYLHRYKAEPK